MKKNIILNGSKPVFTELVSVDTVITTPRTGADVGKSVKHAIFAGFIAFLAIIVCIIAIGAAHRAEQGGVWHWSFRQWFDVMSLTIGAFPLPNESWNAIDYIKWTGDIMAWFVLFIPGFMYGGWVNEPFDGSVGAIPITPPVQEGGDVA